MGSLTHTPCPLAGPNTGGKTASLKTLGLQCLMAKAGLFLPQAPAQQQQPAEEIQQQVVEAQPPQQQQQQSLLWFDRVLADLGDGQSLQQSLSTFSGHLRRIRNVLAAATPQVGRWHLCALRLAHDTCNVLYCIRASVSHLPCLPACSRWSCWTRWAAGPTLLRARRWRRRCWSACSARRPSPTPPRTTRSSRWLGAGLVMLCIVFRNTSLKTKTGSESRLQSPPSSCHPPCRRSWPPPPPGLSTHPSSLTSPRCAPPTACCGARRGTATPWRWRKALALHPPWWRPLER